MSTKVEKLFAHCSKCGTKVGCGCQLVNGLCAHCNAQQNKK